MTRQRIEDGFNHEKLIKLPDTAITDLQSHPLTEDLYLTAIGYFPKADHHYYARPNGHEAPILIFCVNGQGTIDLCGLTIPLKKNQVYIIPPNVPHAYQADLIDPWSIYWVHIGGRLKHEYLSLVQPKLTKIEVMPQQHPQLIRYFNEMLALLDMGYSQEHLLHTASLLKSFFTALNHTSTVHGKANSNQSLYTMKAIEQMQTKLSDPMTLRWLADQLNLSESYLQHIFKEKTGSSPMQYYTQLKLQKSCQLLMTSNAPIKTIAKQVGYSDPYYFSRIFKNTMGVSPRAYRKIKSI